MAGKWGSHRVNWALSDYLCFPGFVLPPIISGSNVHPSSFPNTHPWESLHWSQVVPWAFMQGVPYVLRITEN